MERGGGVQGLSSGRRRGTLAVHPKHAWKLICVFFCHYVAGGQISTSGVPARLSPSHCASLTSPADPLPAIWTVPILPPVLLVGVF